MTGTINYHSVYLNAFMQGMRQALDEWPAVSTVEAVRAQADSWFHSALTQGVARQSLHPQAWAYWYHLGWQKMCQMIETQDVESYRWERYKMADYLRVYGDA